MDAHAGLEWLLAAAAAVVMVDVSAGQVMLIVAQVHVAVDTV